MNQQDLYNKKTDQAWMAIYSRLEQDGLLTQKQHRPSTTQTNLFRWAAAILLLCLSVASVYYLNQSTPDVSTLALQNDESATTLVASLEDGSIVYLADNARLEYPEHFSNDKRKVYLQGSALFEVSGNPDQPFVIEAGKTQIEVIGTAFHVKNAKGKPFELAVQEGTVKVTVKESKEIQYVNAGETVQLSATGLVLSVTDETEQFYRYGRHVQFRDVALGDILRVINQKNPDVVLTATPTLLSRRLTVSLYDDSPESVAELLSAAFNLKYTEREGTLLISEP